MSNKITKLAIASIFVISLGACSRNNVSEGPRNVSSTNLGPRYMSTNDLANPTRVSTGDLNNPQNANQTGHYMNVAYQSPLFTSIEIQPLNSGFIPIQPNSYSTSIPSHNYPYTTPIQQGNFWYYSFQHRTTQPKPRMTKQRNGSLTTSPRTLTRKPSSLPSNAVINQSALKVIALTNAERKKNGLPPLKTDTPLCKVAQTKTIDMETKNYFSHTSPTYGSPFEMMRDFGITYRTAGENIAMGQPTPEDVVNAWMLSEGHRRNILDPNYTGIGVGYTATGNYWSQMFIGK